MHVIGNLMKNTKVNADRRTFFKKAGIGAVAAGVLSALPLSLLSKEKKSENGRASNNHVAITINPMAVKRENKK